MIDSKDLREGIWVRSIHTGPTQVTLFMIGEIADDETYLDHLMPIPLSPDVLKACGFKQWGRFDMPRTITYELPPMTIFPSNSFCDFEGYGFIHYKLSNTIDEMNKGINESAKFKFQYLHQLQNLFYSLTGTELSYTP